MIPARRRRVSVFGATGSIGKNTLNLIAQASESYQVGALTAFNNVEALTALCIAHRAEMAVIANPKRYKDLKVALEGSGIEVAAGREGLIAAATHPADWVMSAIIGVAGLVPGLAALEQGTTLALANKESLVAAGALFMKKAAECASVVIPTDSEHSGVFQVLIGQDRSAVEKITLTASGGPFRTHSLSALEGVELSEALKHPIWKMGNRITIDSASMFNKALEMIEAREFFGLEPSEIEIVVHPQSVLHALVQFRDGGVLAHLGPSDMRHAIGFALNWPDRRHLRLERIDLAKIGQLTFEAPDETRFPALRLARAVMTEGGLAGAVFNGAKEHALDAFIEGRIKFTDMATVTEQALERFSATHGFACEAMTLEAVLQSDHIARSYAGESFSYKTA